MSNSFWYLDAGIEQCAEFFVNLFFIEEYGADFENLVFLCVKSGGFDVEGDVFGGTGDL